MIVPATPESIANAAAMLREGKLIAFPTETVYGLGADATDDEAVAAIYAAKGRPQINPLIIHVSDVHTATKLTQWNGDAQLLAEKFWPGPLTLVLPRAPNCPVSLLASAGMETIAIRIPSHPIARALLDDAAIPVAAPSANASGKLSPTTAEHVLDSLGDKVGLILDGGATPIGVESTVVNLTSPRPTILRPGGITREQIEQVLGQVNVISDLDGNAPLAPGMLASHYAPRALLRMNATYIGADEALLGFGPDDALAGGAERLNLSARGDVQEAAANLFAMLRRLDDTNPRRIAVMPIPDTGLGAAINDRLRRACVR